MGIVEVAEPSSVVHPTVAFHRLMYLVVVELSSAVCREVPLIRLYQVALALTYRLYCPVPYFPVAVVDLVESRTSGAVVLAEAHLVVSAVVALMVVASAAAGVVVAAGSRAAELVEEPR